MADKKNQPVRVDPNPEVMKIANAVRAKGNMMTDEQREDSLRRGMQLIYGGNGGIPAKTGRP